MMTQYFRIKKEHPDALLFFRLGDFYEMFYEDARTASPVLEIALTSRQKVPMCGVPYHAVNSYLAKLLRRGFKVAVCEQTEDPRAARGVVRREVIKVLTPGTAVEVENGEARENVYIASVLVREDGWGLAFVDLVSGEVRTLQGRPEDSRAASDELFKVSPHEILFPEGEEDAVSQLLRPQGAFSVTRSAVEAWAFDPLQARELIEEHFRVRSLAGFGLDGMDLAISAAGALLHYVRKVRKDSVNLVHRIRYVHSGDRLVLDAATVRNLELVRNIRDDRQKDTLLEIMDLTMTSMGGRMLRGWILEPLCDAGTINARLDAVEEALRLTIDRHEVREELKGIHDLERLTGKISLCGRPPQGPGFPEEVPRAAAADKGKAQGLCGRDLPGGPGTMGRRPGYRRAHRQDDPRRTGLSDHGRRDRQGGFQRRSRRAEDRVEVRQSLHRAPGEEGKGADGDLFAQGSLQQSLRFLYRCHETQSPPGPVRLYSQADARGLGALSHARTQGT